VRCAPKHHPKASSPGTRRRAQKPYSENKTLMNELYSKPALNGRAESCIFCTNPELKMSCTNKQIKSFPWMPLPLALLGFLIPLPLLFLLEIPQNDVAARYAPMAEAFAAGQWKFAFHPRVPPLHTVTAGLFAMALNINGFTAAQLASALFFALGILPFYGILRRVFDQKTATIASFLYLFCAPWLELAFSGLRDSAKGAALLLAVYGIVLIFKHRKKWSGYLWTAIGCGGLALVRGDCLLYALLLLGTAFLMELRQNRLLCFPLRSLIAGALFFLLIAPWVQYQYKTIGYPVAAVQQAHILMRIEKQFGISLSRPTPSTPEPATNQPLSSLNKVLSDTSANMSARTIRKSNVKPADFFFLKKDSPSYAASEPIEKKYTLLKFSKSTSKGFYPPFALIAFAMIFYRIWNKLWAPTETILLLMVLLHFILQVGQIALANRILYVSSRYLIGASLLLFGWAALGLITIYRTISPSLRSKKWLRLIPCGLLIALYLHAGQRIIKPYTSEKSRTQKQAILACAEWIRTVYPNCGQYDPKPLTHPLLYHTGKRPRILTSEPSVGLFVSGEPLHLSHAKKGIQQSLRSLDIDFMAVSRQEAAALDLDTTKTSFTSGPNRYDMFLFDLRHKSDQ